MAGHSSGSLARCWPPMLVLLVGGIALSRLRIVDEPLDHDLTTYAVIAHELLAGRALYVDLWDHKPPAIHVTFALGEILMGYGPLAVHALGLVGVVLGTLAVHRAGLAVGGAISGAWAAVLYVVRSNDVSMAATQPNTEVFLNASLAWALALLLGWRGGCARRAVAVGGLLAAASLYKPVALATTGLLVLVHAAYPPPGCPRWRAAADVAALLGALAVAWVLVGAYFTGVGALGDFFHAVFTFNRWYPTWGAGAGVLANLASGLRPERLVHPHTRFIVPLVILGLAGLVLGLAAGRRRQVALVVAFTVGAFVSIAAPGQFYEHYYQLWLPALVVGAAWGTGELARRLPPRRAWLGAAPVAATVAITLAHMAPSGLLSAEASTVGRTYRLYLETEQLGLVLDRWLGPGETFYHWGDETGLYFASRRRPPSGVIYSLPLRAGPLAAELTERVLDDLRRRPPEIVVVSRALARAAPEHPIRTWIAAHYREVPSPTGEENFVIAVRRGGRLDAGGAS
jgi:hypothetical protein